MLAHCLAALNQSKALTPNRSISTAEVAAEYRRVSEHFSAMERFSMLAEAPRGDILLFTKMNDDPWNEHET